MEDCVDDAAKFELDAPMCFDGQCNQDAVVIFFSEPIDPAESIT